jgi:hypothetical protein
VSRWVANFLYPEDGGDMFLRNFDLHDIYTALHPRKRDSSYFSYVYYIVVVTMRQAPYPYTYAQFFPTFITDGEIARV